MFGSLQLRVCAAIRKTDVHDTSQPVAETSSRPLKQIRNGLKADVAICLVELDSALGADERNLCVSFGKRPNSQILSEPVQMTGFSEGYATSLLLP